MSQRENDSFADQVMLTTQMLNGLSIHLSRQGYSIRYKGRMAVRKRTVYIILDVTIWANEQLGLGSHQASQQNTVSRVQQQIVQPRGVPDHCVYGNHQWKAKPPSHYHSRKSQIEHMVVEMNYFWSMAQKYRLNAS
jgi:hypothetical protein